MDAGISCLEGNDNKENIPPISFTEISSADSVLRDSKLLSNTTTGTRKFKRKFRMPLRDVTKSFTVVAQPDLGLNSVPNSTTSSFSAAGLNSGKRKAFSDGDFDDIDWKHKVSSKMLRKGFR